MSPHRQRAIARLLDERTRRPVCLVLGAAGWGKSTAVAGWAAGTRTAWVRKVGRAAADVAQAVQAVLAPHLDAGVPTGEAAALGGRLAATLREDLTIVIDDVQDMRPGHAGARFVAELCEHAPPRLHVVLVSRSEPPFPLDRLRARGLVSDVDATDLALTRADIDWSLRGRIGEVAPALLDHVWGRTSGWPVAVAAAVEMLQRSDPDRRLAVVDGLVRAGTPFYAYLDAVISAEPRPAQNLLRHLAMVGEVGDEPETDGPERSALLFDLDRRGLVVRRIGAEGTRWALVRPLLDFYDADARLTPAERLTLHLAAAQDRLAPEVPAEALRHLAVAGDHLRSVTVLGDHGETPPGRRREVLDAGRGRTSAATGDAPDPPRPVRHPYRANPRRVFIPAARVPDLGKPGPAGVDPRLAWLLAQEAVLRGDLADIGSLIDRTRFGRDTPEATQLLALAAIACRLRGDVPGLSELAARAATSGRRSGAWSAAAALVQTALAVQAGVAADRRTLAVHCAAALESAAVAGNLVLAASVWLTWAGHLVELGMPLQAADDARTAVRLGVRCEDSFITALALTIRGRAHIRLGRLDDAAADLETAVELLQRTGSRFLAWPLCGLGDLHAIRGRPARARGVYEEALALAEAGPDVLGMSCALTGLARVRAPDDPDAARDLARRAVALGDGLREVPALLTRGWVALVAGDPRAAAADARAAAAAARRRRDNPGQAEAILLDTLAGTGAGTPSGLGPLSEAIDMWREAGCVVDAAVATVVAERIGPDAKLGTADGAADGGAAASTAVDAAVATLRDCGIDLDALRTAGPLAAAHPPARPRLLIKTLGTFQVLRHGGPVARAASGKARDLLKVLVSKRRPVPREQLMELLWPGSNPAKSANRMSVLLSTVRDLLGPDRTEEGPLITDGNTVGLDRRWVDVDVDQFLAATAEALAAYRAGDSGAATLLAAAEARYQGGYLEDDPYQDWAQPLAEEVRAAHIALLRALAWLLREDDLDGMVRYTLRLLEHDNYDEPAHIELVSALMQAGRLGEARRRYRLYVAVMKEIGVKPQQMPVPRRGTG